MKTNATDVGAPSRLPLMMNAFGLPGIGQCLQRRWIAAAVFLLGSLLSAVFFFVHAYRILASFYNLWLRFDSNEPIELPSCRGLVIWLAIGIAVYVAALADAYQAYVRARTQWNLRRSGRANPS